MFVATETIWVEQLAAGDSNMLASLTWCQPVSMLLAATEVCGECAGAGKDGVGGSHLMTLEAD